MISRHIYTQVTSGGLMTRESFQEYTLDYIDKQEVANKNMKA